MQFSGTDQFINAKHILHYLGRSRCVAHKDNHVLLILVKKTRLCSGINMANPYRIVVQGQFSLCLILCCSCGSR
ncbi:MAG: hypothetical protein C0402_08445 [Thermodesulfovibrio sp.]|nr:hypothetical protein [Thermodesulfovibrio sp.]